MFLASSNSFVICSFATRKASLLALNRLMASSRFNRLCLILPVISLMFCYGFLKPFPPQRVHGRPSPDLPLPLHWVHLVSPSKWLLPLPPHTIQGTLAPSGFFPEPEQKTHFFSGCTISVFPVPLQTIQADIGESKSKGSFPLPLQNAHLMMFDMTYAGLWL